MDLPAMCSKSLGGKEHPRTMLTGQWPEARAEEGGERPRSTFIRLIDAIKERTRAKNGYDLGELLAA